MRRETSNKILRESSHGVSFRGLKRKVDEGAIRNRPEIEVAHTPSFGKCESQHCLDMGWLDVVQVRFWGLILRVLHRSVQVEDYAFFFLPGSIPSLKSYSNTKFVKLMIMGP